MKQAILTFILIVFPVICWGQTLTHGYVLDAKDGSAITGAAVISDNGAWAVTDTLGRFAIKANSGRNVNITCLGYTSLKGTLSEGVTYRLQPDMMLLDEVVITATENRGVTSSSRIRQDAIAHIQPSSFADLLELIPGGRASDPAFSSPQIINLRSANSFSNSDYATSALGTSFVIDGRPVGNDANLQSTPAWSNYGSTHVNLGTDMRTITTEDIEEVEIVRGIASVESGDLTSGLIKITRRKGGNNLRARFKADMKSKLFYVGKDMERGESTLNLSANYLNSNADPRNPRQSYSRLTGSIRTGKTWGTYRDYKTSLNANLDYTGSFDAQKSDKDLDNGTGGPIETYRSTYNSVSLSGNITITANKTSFLRVLTANASVTASHDVIDRWRHVTLGTETHVTTSTEPGEFDAVPIPSSYDATLKVDGLPFYAHANVNALFKAGIHDIKAGAEWHMDKNYGSGSIFDPSRPFSTEMSSRPRPYYGIPSDHKISAFLEEKAKLLVGEASIQWSVGIRATSMAGAGKSYSINLKPYLDPRVNIRFRLPEILINNHVLNIGIYGGAGMHTKFPTMSQLYPAPIYTDRTQFNYWPVEKDFRRINKLVFKIDPTNHDIRAARNFKWEIGTDIDWNGFSLSVDYFREDMTSGFRYASKPLAISYKDYDESAVDKSTISGPPSLDNIPYVIDTVLTTYSFTTNGSRTLKEGIEFTLSTKRIPAINTRIYVTGAWFRTRHMNSQPEYWRPSITISGKTYPYLGLYAKNDGTLYETVNTNIMFDTQVPSIGLIFSTSFQAVWFTGQQSMPDDATPIAWIDKTLTEHPFTTADASDGILSNLVREYTKSLYQYTRIPFRMDINLKVSKKLYRDKATCSLFVNKIFDITPNYRRNDVLVRRDVIPYFGMEIDFKL